MNEYISREEIVSEIRSRVSIAEDLQEIGYNTAMAEMMQWIKHIPAADVEPVKHGRWIRGENKSAFPAEPPTIWYCSCCGEMIRYNDSTGTYQKKKKKVNEVNPRCRRCGARMDGGAKQ